MWLAALWACTALTGLETLEQLPDGFPLAIEGEIGVITSPQGSEQVAVDVAFPSPARARQGWIDLRAQAESRGFVVAHEGHHDKREVITLEAPAGRLELGCCRPRADRKQLVFVTWWPATTP